VSISFGNKKYKKKKLQTNRLHTSIYKTYPFLFTQKSKNSI